MKRFENKVALVTGAAKGIGFATAERLCAEGASVVVADYDLEGAKKACQTLNDAGGNAVAVYFNAAELESSRDLAAHTLKNFGRIDVVVNNAGYADPKRDADLLHADLDYFDEVFHVMVRSMMVITQQAVAWMTANGGGAIVNVASIGGLTGNLTGCYYGICKAGSVNFTRYVATQYGKARRAMQLRRAGTGVDPGGRTVADRRVQGTVHRAQCGGLRRAAGRHRPE